MLNKAGVEKLPGQSSAAISYDDGFITTLNTVMVFKSRPK